MTTIQDLQKQNMHQEQKQVVNNNNHNNKPDVDIDELTRDISESLNDKNKIIEDSNDDTFDNDDNKLEMTKTVKEMVLLLAIYFIMSQAIMRQFFASYIVFLNPNQDGVVSQAGILVYGIIMIAIFLFIKKFL